jgi:hypothetical protein
VWEKDPIMALLAVTWAGQLDGIADVMPAVPALVFLLSAFLWTCIRTSRPRVRELPSVPSLAHALLSPTYAYRLRR